MSVARPRMLRLGPLDPFARAFVTTRRFPVRFEKTDDLKLRKNQTKLEKVLKKYTAARRFVYLNQVHSARVGYIDAQKARRKFTRLERTDGVVTKDEKIVLIAMTADCLPVFFSVKGPDGRPWVALAHAGWKGTRGRISVKVLKLLCRKSGARSSQVRVVLGPRIGSCCYEVGPEFAPRFPKNVFKEKEKVIFDLAGENRRQLLDAGVLRTHLSDTARCTVCENALFYSYRLEKEKAGRLLSLAFIAV